MPRDSARGDTRGRILASARSRFAEVGFRAATVRSVARDAGIDPALVMRHFGSKAGLFAAAVDVDLRIPDLRAVPHAEHGECLVEHFLSRWDGGTPEGDVLLTLLRSAVAEPAIADRLRDVFAQQLVPALAAVVSDEHEVPQRAGLVATQMLGLALTRTLLELPPVAEMSTRAITANLGATIQRYLHDGLAG